MRRFLLHITLFCSLCCLFLAIPEWFYEYKAQHSEKAMYRVANSIHGMKGQNFDGIIIGNSRGGHYFVEVLDSASGHKWYNMSWSGHSFDYVYNILYKQYRLHNGKPKYIIVDVGPWSFFEFFGDELTIEKLPLINYDGFEYLINRCPELTWKDRILLVRYAGREGKLITAITQLVEKDPTNVPFKDVVFFPEGFPLEKNPRIIADFKKFIGECEAEGIKLVIVFSPMHSSKGQPQFDLDGMWGIVDGCVKGHDVPILRYGDMYGSDTSYFYDYVHMSRRGSRGFSKKLIHDMDSLGIIPIKHSLYEDTENGK